jgi:hypothetical protein
VATVVGLADGVTPASLNNVSFAVVDAALVGAIAVLAVRQQAGVRAAAARQDQEVEGERAAIAAAQAG